MKTLLPLFFLLTTQVSFGQWSSQVIQTTNTLASVCFKNDNTGFTCGGSKIFKTINGGEDWTPAYSGGNLFQIEDVKIVGDSIVLAVGIDLAKGKSLVVRSEDEGDSWTQIATTTPYFLKSLCFVDAQTIFSSGSGGSILKSINGGLHWATQASGTNSLLYSIVFLDNQKGFAAGGTPGTATLLKTVDGGANWTAVNLNSTNNLQSLFFVDDQTVYLVGWNGEILKTQDGGDTWSNQTSVNMEGNLDVFFTDHNTGYIVGGGFNQGSIQKTKNGAALWEEIGPGNAYGLVGVFFPSTNIGYAVGANGTVLKTTSGGVSGIQDIIDPQRIQCYPNPFHQNLTVKASATTINSIEIYDTRGILIQQLETHTDQLDLDLSVLTPGNYYLAVEGGQGKTVQRVVKL